MPIFKLGLAIPIKSHVWKFGSDWLSLSRVIIWIFRGGRNPLLGGCKWPVMPIFGLGWAIPVKSHLCKFGSDWLNLSRVIVSTNIFLWGRHPLLGGVTFELWCPFLNSDELFQSKVMCGNLVWIDWNRRQINFEGGGLHVTCDAHFWTWPRLSRYKSCVKIWFRLVEAFKSYRSEKTNDTRTRTRTRMRTRTKNFKVRSRSSPYRWA